MICKKLRRFAPEITRESASSAGPRFGRAVGNLDIAKRFHSVAPGNPGRSVAARRAKPLSVSFTALTCWRERTVYRRRGRPTLGATASLTGTSAVNRCTASAAGPGMQSPISVVTAGVLSNLVVGRLLAWRNEATSRPANRQRPEIASLRWQWPIRPQSRGAWRRCRQGSRSCHRPRVPVWIGCGQPAPGSTGTGNRCRSRLCRSRSLRSDGAGLRR